MTFDPEKVADYLEDEGFGTTGTDIVFMDFPNDPVECTCIIPYHAGEGVVHTFGNGGRPTKSIEYPYLQVQVRSATKSVAWSKLQSIRDSLDGADITGIKSIILLSSCPENFEKGESVNYRFACDFKLII